MNVGDYKKFDKYCGIARVQDEETEEQWFVCYSLCDELIFAGELGECIGKGKSELDAMKDAIKNLSKMCRQSVNINTAKRCVINALKEHKGLPLGKDELLIFPVEDWVWNSAEDRMDASGEYRNANIKIIDGKAVAGLA